MGVIEKPGDRCLAELGLNGVEYLTEHLIAISEHGGDLDLGGGVEDEQRRIDQLSDRTE